MADEVTGKSEGRREDDEDAGGEEGEEGDEEENDEEEEEEEEEQEPLYDGKEFQDLLVSPDVKKAFANIALYTPRVVELELKLYPFIPEFMPAVGDIDAFIKVRVGCAASLASGCELLADAGS